MSAAPTDDSPDAGEGGTGAPPPPRKRNRAPGGLTKEYRGESIRVQWYAGRCIHSAECIRSLPRVFDPERRPWILLGAASADEVARAVERCPTGALHYTRTDGGPPEAVPDALSIELVPDGPYYLRGPVRVCTSAGELVREDTRVALCRCGRSEQAPFCDNAHRATGFRDPGSVVFPEPDDDPPAAEGEHDPDDHAGPAAPPGPTDQPRNPWTG